MTSSKDTNPVPYSTGRIVSVVYIGLFTALITIGAYISFPLPLSPVPVSLQTLFVVLAGILLGPLRGTAAVGLYLVLGIAGLPVFAQTGVHGIGRILGPTGGYLVGFLPGALVSGILFGIRTHFRLRISRAETDGFHRRLGTALAAGTAGLAGFLVIYAVGVPWLKTVNEMAWASAVSFGFLPFVAGDILKIAAVCFVAPAAVSWFGHASVDGTA